MQVELLPFMIKQPSPWGEVLKRHGHDKVIVNGALAGYAPIEGEPYAGVFHPLSGFPQELVADVVANSGGKLKSALAAPVPSGALDPIEAEDILDGDDCE